MKFPFLRRISAPLQDDLRSLARPATAAPNKSTFELIERLQQMMTVRSRQDIGTWRAAIAAAENPLQPNRIRLNALYRDVLLDDQVETVIENLIADLLGQEWHVAGEREDDIDEEATALLERPWLYDFIRYFVESFIHGHSLVEFAPPTLVDGKREIFDIALIPRDHVIPEWGLVVMTPGDTTGVSYRTPEYLKSVIEMGRPTSLGWLLKASRPALYKKNVEAAWSQYSEIFGMPIRIGKVASRNKAEIDKMEEFLKNMGQAAYAVTDIEDKIEFAESTKGDAYKVFDQFIQRCDAAIAKIFLGQTMTVDNGSSRSQAEVHERVAEQRMKSLKQGLRFTIQRKLFPLLVANGYPLQGKRFVWAVADDINELDIAMDTFLVNSFEMDNLDYFAKKYKVPVKALRAQPGASAEPPSGKADKGSLARIAQLQRDIHNLYTPHDGDCC